MRACARTLQFVGSVVGFFALPCENIYSFAARVDCRDCCAFPSWELPKFSRGSVEKNLLYGNCCITVAEKWLNFLLIFSHYA